MSQDTKDVEDQRLIEEGKPPKYKKPFQKDEPPPYKKKPFKPPGKDLQVYEPSKSEKNKKSDKSDKSDYPMSVIKPGLYQNTVNTVYEDVLPSTQFSSTANTLGERNNIYQFVRSVFISQGDGEDIDIGGQGNNSLMKYLKYMQLNPYADGVGCNLYRSLPSGMLIYRSCYPIRYDMKGNKVKCAKNSIGINIRIYRMTNEEYYIKQLPDSNYNNHNLWREIAYYEYLREEILKQNICPNFIMMFGYYISERCNIDFQRIELMKGKLMRYQAPYVSSRSLKRDQYRPISIGGGKIDDPESVQSGGVPMIYTPTLVQIRSVPSLEVQKNPKAFSGRALVSLTEAPTQNLFDWASKVYVHSGNINRMISTGFHKSEVWLSVLFQLLAALYTLQIHQIAFDNFSIEDNVYIKDVAYHDNITKYWKYKIDGVDYYVPNYGYLVMIDSNYKDLCSTYTVGLRNKRNKIYSAAFKDVDIDKHTFAAFKNCFGNNIFSKEFTNEGGVPPPDDIKSILDSINSDITAKTSENIGDYIHSHMSKLLNNRTGTYLTEYEVPHIRKDDYTPFKKGQMVVQEIQHDTYRFVVFKDIKIKDPKTDMYGGQMAIIFSREDPIKNKSVITQNVVRLESLFNYSKFEPIKQEYKPNLVNLNEEELLETYTIMRS